MRDKGNRLLRFVSSNATKKVNLPTLGQDSLQEELLSGLGIN